MDQTTRGFAKAQTEEHPLDWEARVTINVHELQNRCGGESSQAGSIPVRLRELHACHSLDVS